MTQIAVHKDVLQVPPPPGQTVTVTNLAGATLYYADYAQVSAGSNLGSLSAGQSTTAFSEPIWVVSASETDVTLTYAQSSGSGGSGGSSTLAGDTDVAIATPANNQGLVYNTATGKWVNATLTAALVGADASGAAASETTRAEAAEALLAPLASPALTGAPTAPTAAALDATTKLATTAYADSAVGVEKTRAQAAEGTNAAAILTMSAITMACAFGVA